MRRKIALAMAAILMAPAAHAQDAKAGEKVFKKCMACHQAGEGAKNRTGPVLTGVIGRPAGSYDGFKYSRHMVAAGENGLVWTQENVFEYLADPSAFLKEFLGDSGARAKMSFRLKDEGDRRDVIAYLATFETAALDNGQFCIANQSVEAHLFAVETREGARNVQTVAPGGQLCSEPTAAADGIVSVYESADALEGCSRVVAAGGIEGMRTYAAFDRCSWQSIGHS